MAKSPLYFWMEGWEKGLQHRSAESFLNSLTPAFSSFLQVSDSTFLNLTRSGNWKIFHDFSLWCFISVLLLIKLRFTFWLCKKYGLRWLVISFCPNNSNQSPPILKCANYSDYNLVDYYGKCIHLSYSCQAMFLYLWHARIPSSP